MPLKKLSTKISNHHSKFSVNKIFPFIPKFPNLKPNFAFDSCKKESFFMRSGSESRNGCGEQAVKAELVPLRSGSESRNGCGEQAVKAELVPLRSGSESCFYCIKKTARFGQFFLKICFLKSGFIGFFFYV